MDGHSDTRVDKHTHHRRRSCTTQVRPVPPRTAVLLPRSGSAMVGPCLTARCCSDMPSRRAPRRGDIYVGASTACDDCNCRTRCSAHRRTGFDECETIGLFRNLRISENRLLDECHASGHCYNRLRRSGIPEDASGGLYIAWAGTRPTAFISRMQDNLGGAPRGRGHGRAGCAGTTQRGTACTRSAQEGRRFCWQH